MRAEQTNPDRGKATEARESLELIMEDITIRSFTLCPNSILILNGRAIRNDTDDEVTIRFCE